MKCPACKSALREKGAAGIWLHEGKSFVFRSPAATTSVG
jgi:ribosomal protein L37AE/L43A